MSAVCNVVLELTPHGVTSGDCSMERVEIAIVAMVPHGKPYLPLYGGQARVRVCVQGQQCEPWVLCSDIECGAVLRMPRHSHGTCTPFPGPIYGCSVVGQFVPNRYVHPYIGDSPMEY